MRVNWFSPLPPAKSGIATYTANLLPALARQADVTLWTDQPEWDASLEEWASVRPYARGAPPWIDVNRADLSFLHMGNNCEYHAGIWELSQVHPGIVVLHDVSLQHLFTGIYLEYRRDRETYLDRMHRDYGPDGLRDALACLRGEITTEVLGERYPLTGYALERAAGVVVHSGVAREVVRRECSSPVLYAGLPYCPEGGADSRAKGWSSPPYRIIMFGHIAPNRGIEIVLRALAGLADRELFQFDVYGNLWDRAHVENEIESLDLREMVSLHGFVDDSVLTAAIEGADLAVNLRYPSMGEASLSQLQLWAAGVPSLVSRVGWYAEAPDDAVGFVRADHAVEDVQCHLLALANDQDRFREIGARGRAHLLARHSSDRYASALAAFASKALRYGAGLTAIDLAERAGQAISPWSGNGVSSGLYRRAAERIHALFLAADGGQP
jgi:glycosyltransferase involved in cell wall biosynthesis